MFKAFLGLPYIGPAYWLLKKIGKYLLLLGYVLSNLNYVSETVQAQETKSVEQPKTSTLPDGVCQKCNIYFKKLSQHLGTCKGKLN